MPVPAFPSLGDFLAAALSPGASADDLDRVLRQQLSQPGAYPWLQPGTGETVFVWFDDSSLPPDLAGEPAVLLSANLHGWPTRKDKAYARPFFQIPGTRVHVRSEAIPTAARIHYKLLVAERVIPVHDTKLRNGFYAVVRIADRLILDPLNPLRSFEGSGPHSVVQMPEFSEPDLLRRRPASVPADRLREFDWAGDPAAGKSHKVRVWLPPTFDESNGKGYPLLLVHDGNVYGNALCGLERSLEYLTASGQMEPVIAIFVAHNDRERELRTHDGHAEAIMHDLLPRLRAEYPVSTFEGIHGNIGVSYGALFSAWLCGRYPDVFGRGIFHAGAYAGVAMRSLVEGTLDNSLRYPGRYWMDCGTFDSHWPHFLAMRAAFTHLGVDCACATYRECHEWTAWVSRDALALPHIFPTNRS